MEAADGEEKARGKEGSNLLGSPTFTKLQNGKFKCVETGHELFEHELDSYSRSKRCRIGLIDFALATSKLPLNIFKQDPLSRSKLICKLTGDTVNKSEEHIWKHINGRRFLNKLELKETANGCAEEGEQRLKKEAKSSVDGVKKSKKKKEKTIEEIITEVRGFSDKDSDSEEADFWMPPVGDRLSSGSELEKDNDEENGADNEKVSKELSARTKRMTVEIGPSSFASRKKKSRKDL